MYDCFCFLEILKFNYFLTAACSLITCSNGGTCLSLSGGTSWTCLCLPGYTGDRCQQLIGCKYFNKIYN